MTPRASLPRLALLLAAACAGNGVPGPAADAGDDGGAVEVADAAGDAASDRIADGRDAPADAIATDPGSDPAADGTAESPGDAPSDTPADVPADPGPPVDRWGFPPDHPLLAPGLRNIAHRGGGRLAPEESLEAYRNALEVGADVLEMDLHATSDGVVVLHHDADVSRITDGKGEIRDMTFAQVRELDAGWSFTPDGGLTHPWRGRGVRVASFREVLEAFPGALFSAEIKQEQPSIVDAVLEVLAATGMEDRVILVSFQDPVVQEVRARNPRIVTGAGIVEMLAFQMLEPGEFDDYVPPCPVLQLSSVTPEGLGLAHRLGMKVQVWTVNDAGAMREWLDLGVDGVMTDDPALLESVLGERRGRGGRAP